MPERASADVTFRHIEIVTDKASVPAICLCYPREVPARRVGEMVQEYMTAPSGSRQLRVEFTQRPDLTYGLTVSIQTSGRGGVIEIDGIDAEFVRQIRSALSDVAYYVILLGYDSNDGFQLLNPREFNLFKKDLVIDGETVIGVPQREVDWQSLLDEV